MMPEDFAFEHRMQTIGFDASTVLIGSAWSALTAAEGGCVPAQADELARLEALDVGTPLQHGR